MAPATLVTPWLSRRPPRDLILDAAARLFAERGVDNVSIAEIVRAAGQRNTSAVHYHFGSRDEVLRAVLARHVSRAGGAASSICSSRLELDRLVMLARRPWRSSARSPNSPRAVGANAAYLQIGSELAGAVDRVNPDRPRSLETDGRSGGVGTLCGNAVRRSRRTSGLRGRRSALCSLVGPPPIGPANLTRAAGASVLSDDRFVDNLVEMLLGAMKAPHRAS